MQRLGGDLCPARDTNPAVLLQALLLSAFLVTGCQEQPAPETDTASRTAAQPETTPPPRPEPTTPNYGLEVPVEYYKLDNGLRVVLSPDDTAPIATVAVHYGIGFRIEPRDRTGFAHLFEHMMFQGSENLGKMEFIKLIQANGGVLNGSTRFDFTNYFEIVPAHALETTLWAEADRMGGLAITQDNLTNQQGVVKNEVKVNVLNRPYGGFPWLDMPQYANENWYNAHNFYGELDDLDAATLEDVQSFFDKYYAPSNAVVTVVGDFDSAQVKDWIQQYFGDLPTAPRPELPDVSEPRQEQAKRFEKDDPLATRPALAVAWHAPPRDSKEYMALGLLHEILASGEDSRLYHALVRERGLTGGLNASINFLGNMFNIQGPTLYTMSLFHDADVEADTILQVIEAEVERLRTEPVAPEVLERARTKMRSSLYDQLEGFYGFGRADLLASYALFFDDPDRINTLEQRFEEVTPELLLATAREYLRPTNQTVLTLKPGAGS